MNHYVTGTVVRQLREKRGYTQKQLAEQLCVSDKTISKWETGKGLPDISLLGPLASALGVTITELLSGEYTTNANRSGNLKRGWFYVCPVCGNVIYALGEGTFACCGIVLPRLEAEEDSADHEIVVEAVETEKYITVKHPMEKSHYISFFAYVTSDRAEILKLYPEQNAEGRFMCRGRGKLYAFCNRHGLFCRDI